MKTKQTFPKFPEKSINPRFSKPDAPAQPKERFTHDVCPNCSTPSVPAEGVPDQTLRGCPKCGHGWSEDLGSPPAEAQPLYKQQIKAFSEKVDAAIELAEQAERREAQHSPLPWAIRVTRAHAGAPKNVRICDHVGLTVSVVHGSATAGVAVETVNIRKDTNAAFIVRACNNIEQLERHCNSNAKAYQEKYDECEKLRAHAQRLADALKQAESALAAFVPQHPAGPMAREALAQWEGGCSHNAMVANDDPQHAWQCADCGHVYGKEAESQ